MRLKPRRKATREVAPRQVIAEISQLQDEIFLLETLMDNVPDYIYFKDRAEPLHAHQPLRGGAVRRRGPGARGRADRLRLLHRGARGEGAARRAGDHPDRPAAGERRGEGDAGGRRRRAGCRRPSCRCAIGDGNIVGTFGISRDITERKKAEEQLQRRAFYDPLTGLPNRALFLDRLQHLFHRARRALGNPLFAVLYLDLDRFKAINDSLGHQAGDELLIGTARRLERCLRPGDTLARLGGDEFTVLLDDVNSRGGRHRRRRAHPRGAGRAARSCAGTRCSPASASASRCRARATTAPRTCCATRTRRCTGPRRPAAPATRCSPATCTSARCRRCGSRPICAARSSAARSSPTTSRSSTSTAARCSGSRRWRAGGTRRAGMLPPDVFIPVAEETGLVGAIGDWMLSEACRQVARMAAQAPALVDARHQRQRLRPPARARRASPPRSSACSARRGLDPACLTLEITESALMHNLKAGAGVDPAAARDVRRPAPGRLRHRLLVAGVPAQLPGPRAQGRSARSSAGWTARPSSPRSSRRSCRSRTTSGMEVDRRGGRDGGPGRRAARAAAAGAGKGSCSRSRFPRPKPTACSPCPAAPDRAGRGCCAVHNFVGAEATAALPPPAGVTFPGA